MLQFYPENLSPSLPNHNLQTKRRSRETCNAAMQQGPETCNAAMQHDPETCNAAMQQSQKPAMPRCSRAQKTAAAATNQRTGLCEQRQRNRLSYAHLLSHGESPTVTNISKDRNQLYEYQMSQS